MTGNPVAIASASGCNGGAEHTEFAQFQRWAQEHGKVYESQNELAIRFANFQESLARIARSNAYSAARNGTARFALNKFSDLSPLEFKAKYMGFNPQTAAESMSKAAVAPVPKYVDPPKSFDWRDKKAVTYVKDQEQCGSCWAFSVVENIESMWFLAGHTLTELSPQQIVDCDKMDQGCDGGIPDTAYQYVMANGIESDDKYPYNGFDGRCKYNAGNVVAQIKNYTYAIPGCNDTCRHQDEKLLQQQLLSVGPLSVCVDADDDWQDYDGGIYMGLCSSDYEEINHCVQLVGYSGDIWFLRNSWSGDWGEDGYILLGMGDNECGMADWVTYANI